jgi:hypothetical protein
MKKMPKVYQLKNPNMLLFPQKKFRVVDFLGCAETRVNFGAAQ